MDAPRGPMMRYKSSVIHSLALLLCTFYAAAPLVNSQQDPCSPPPCGINTRCDLSADGRAAVCRCQAGWNHEPGRNTIDGCPVRIGSQSQQNTRLSRPTHEHTRFSDAVILSANSPSPPIRPSITAPFEGGRGNPCLPNPCGSNAACQPRGGRAVCSCPEDYHGDPYSNCQLDPCKQNACGIDAECDSTGARAICRCPRGWTGDPFVRCLDNPCNDNPCGANADCTSDQGRAVCKCRPNYEGDPFRSCELNPCLTNSCGINADCEQSGSRAICKCRQGYSGDPFDRCNRDPCFDNPCGVNAQCESKDGAAVCTCPPGYSGDPFDTRRGGCELDPCSNSPCGINAECESRGRTAICRCPRGHTGDPYTSCRLDPCSTNPCGQNALCENSGNTAVCRCPPQHTGDPYLNCRFDPCSDNPCGRNTECQASGQRSICRCLRGFSGSPNSRSGCLADPCAASNPCGIEATCENSGGRPVCKCPPGHVGDPYSRCVRGECSSNSDCSDNQACMEFRCVDPCSLSCGSGADCTAQNHVAICRCPRGNTGNPFESCRQFTRSEICAACGANTDCDVGNDGTPICKCKTDYIGNPLTGCRRQCETSRDCSPSQECNRFKCVPVCREGVCGENANCKATNNRAQCSCPTYFLGDGYSRCYTECTKHEECSLSQVCVKFRCEDACLGLESDPCGQGANCEAKNHKPICSCPRGYTGDPFVSCRKFTRADLCTPNPCGEGAECQPGKDRSGADRPVCQCPRGTRGNPFDRCVRGECEHDNECGPQQACAAFSCVDPCQNACGQGAQCRVINHGAVCSCPAGSTGDPLSFCRETRRGSTGAQFRFKRFIDMVTGSEY